MQINSLDLKLEIQNVIVVVLFYNAMAGFRFFPSFLFFNSPDTEHFYREIKLRKE